MKEETVPKFLATGTYSGGTNLDFQMEHYIYKKENGGIYILSVKDPGRSFCQQLMPWLPLKIHLILASSPSGILASGTH